MTERRDQLDVQSYLATLTINATVKVAKERIAKWEPRPMPDNFERRVQ